MCPLKLRLAHWDVNLGGPAIRDAPGRGIPDRIPVAVLALALIRNQRIEAHTTPIHREDVAGPAIEERVQHEANVVLVVQVCITPPGECRVWYAGHPPGQQPPPAKCGRLVGRVPYGAFILYNDKEWDTRYDWRGLERRHRGSVPPVILDLTRSLIR